ncbi:hypothetical protein M0G43_05740 [Subsaxibacter sp. CAU 1640]|uniref:hypothetical protein n=1 Tax=Subsaxibacter sp. CAU 1640 TaxID=2933271 RepID=UPI002002EBCF|nr:hypothetical protein [Subsaxibacter sp. CAU 1640]MCK7590065.1 hypothetical protein [Subsaxibacter sp. CAU 1640]
MNLLNRTTTKFYLSIIILILMTMIAQMANAQNQYTTISKNINPEAQNLYHDLSPQGDSLYLKAETIFYKVAFLNSLDRKVFTFNPPVLESKIALKDIVVGDYTVLVYKRDRIIVFHISRLYEIEKPLQILLDNEISLLNVDIGKTVVKEVAIKQQSLLKFGMNNIELAENFDLGIEEVKFAVNDDNLKIDESNFSIKTKPYNLTSRDRKNMQSREEYRKINLRPNKKTY